MDAHIAQVLILPQSTILA